MFLYSDVGHTSDVQYSELMLDAESKLMFNSTLFYLWPQKTQNLKIDQIVQIPLILQYLLLALLRWSPTVSSPLENSLLHSSDIRNHSSSLLSDRDSSAPDSDLNNFFKYAVLSAAVNLQIKYCKIHYYLIFISTMVFWNKLHITLSCKFFFQQFFIMLSIYFS